MENIIVGQKARPDELAIEKKQALNWLYLDLNSYFATIEQQLDKNLRNKPVIVLPVLSDYTCAIAASYEAKKLGIKTNTKVKLAKELCPELICVLARHNVYVEYHHQILTEINKYLYVDNVLSIDEYACRLTGQQRSEQEAIFLAQKIKAAIRQNVGDYISCSIGIAPNRFLAKVATEIQKPDGLVIIRPEDIPTKLFTLKLRDIPGIGINMEKRLAHFAINSVESLYQQEPKRLRKIWGSVVGERFWYELRGVELDEIETRKSSLGHSRVLSPELRNIEIAKEVFIELILKAASRLRAKNLYTSKIELLISTDQKVYIKQYQNVLKSNDSLYLLQEALKLWEKVVDTKLSKMDKLKKVSVNFSALTEPESRQLSFFDEQIRQEADVNSKLSLALDKLNEKYGKNIIAIGIRPNMKNDNAKIAFHRIPDKKEFF